MSLGRKPTPPASETGMARERRIHVPSEVKVIKWAGLAAFVLGLMVERRISKAQHEAYDEADLVKRDFDKAEKPPLVDQKININPPGEQQREEILRTTASGAAAIRYAYKMVNEIDSKYGDTRLVNAAEALVAKLREDPSLQTSLVSLATEQSHVIADRELRETADFLSRTPIGKVKELIAEVGQGRIPTEFEHIEILGTKLPVGGLLRLTGLGAIHDVGSRLISALEQSPELTLRVLRENFAGQIRGGEYDLSKQAQIIGQIASLASAHQIEGVPVKTAEMTDEAYQIELTDFANAVVAEMLITNRNFLAEGQQIPAEFGTLFINMKLAGILDLHQAGPSSLLNSEPEAQAEIPKGSRRAKRSRRPS